MTLQRIPRFYKEVSVAPAEGGYAVLLDGKAARTPAKNPLVVPNETLANAIADEWRAQQTKVDPAIMPLTRLANTAIDSIPDARDAVVAEIAGFGKSDAVCYRADVPADLAAEQARVWDPLLDWLAERYGAPLACTRGLRFVPQSAEALAALEGAVAAHDNFGLAALSTATAICHSLVIALALAGGRLDAHAAYKAAHVEARYQARRWGRDEEAEARDAARENDLKAAALVLESIRNSP